jgi:UDP-2,3-diacylglucosamine hydrolase
VPLIASPLDWQLPPELHANAAWQVIDFISDLHLAEDTPRGFNAFAAYLQHTPADAVFILGDLFEAWVGDDARFEGFEARCAAVLKAASEKRHVAFMVGNRDFLLGADMLRACGVQALPDPVVLNAFGERVLLTHGDAWCTTDLDYQRLRSEVRSAAWQAAVLAQPLAQRRVLAQQMRAQSELHQASHTGPWFDVDRTTTIAWMERANTPTLIHGHTHRPGDEILAHGRLRRVLSDWDLDHATESRAEVLRWRPSGFARLSPDAATAPIAAIARAT